MVKKTRVNITVDTQLLNKAKKKLDLFGGKLSTLFNAYLSEFVKTMNLPPIELHNKLKELEKRVERLEKD